MDADIRHRVAGESDCVEGGIVFLLKVLLDLRKCWAASARRACVPTRCTTVTHESPLFVQKQAEFLHNFPRACSLVIQILGLCKVIFLIFYL